MLNTELSESARQTIVNALYTAAQRYREDAATVALPRVADQFRRQANEATDMAERLEQAETITLGEDQ